MAEYVAHDKAFFIHHDLGAGVWDRDALLWSLALGYGMSLPVSASSPVSEPERMRWLGYLARVQGTLGPHYLGASLSEFRYLQGSGSQGVMEATYGDMRVVVNLTNQPYRDGAATVAPHDFLARAGKIEMRLPLGLP